MTPSALRTTRKRLGLSQRGLAEALRMGKHGARTVRRWELGEVETPGPIAVALEQMAELTVWRAKMPALDELSDLLDVCEGVCPLQVAVSYIRRKKAARPPAD